MCVWIVGHGPAPVPARGMSRALFEMPRRASDFPPQTSPFEFRVFAGHHGQEHAKNRRPNAVSCSHHCASVSLYFCTSSLQIASARRRFHRSRRSSPSLSTSRRTATTAAGQARRSFGFLFYSSLSFCGYTGNIFPFFPSYFIANIY